MKVVVGLGNPGRKYVGSRHNVGFEILSELANRFSVSRPKSKFNAEIVETIIDDEKTVLVCPLTYMNLSGQCVRAVVDFYKLDFGDLLVICDDFNLNLGKIRLRASGSAGGQNGLNDIINRLGSRLVPRLRLGIGQPPPGWDVSNFVLGRFTENERTIIDSAILRSADAVESWVRDGIGKTMNQYNVDNADKAAQSKSPDDGETNKQN